MKIYIGRFIWHHELDTGLFKDIKILCVSPNLEEVKDCLLIHSDNHCCSWLNPDVNYEIDIYDLENNSFKSGEIYMKRSFKWSDES